MISYAGLKLSQLYLRIIGITGLFPTKAPFLKGSKNLELEVPPSEKMARGGKLRPASTLSCLEMIYLTICCLFSSVAPLAINIDWSAAVKYPSTGLFLNDLLAAKEGVYLVVRRTGMSAQEAWLLTRVDALWSNLST